MKIKVTKDEVKITELPKIHSGEYKANVCEFELSEEYDSLVKKAVFTFGLEKPIKVDIVDNKCDIPVEVLKYGEIKIGVYGYTVENEELLLRYSPTPDKWFVIEGSYVADAKNSEGGTPTEYEQLESRVNGALDDIAEAVENAEKLDVDAEKVDTTTTVTITKQDGSTKSVLILDGEKGEKGDTGEPGQIRMLVVSQLPTVGEAGTLYFVPKQDVETTNLYDEYVYINNAWELLGEKQIVIDLSDYYTKQETNNLLNNKADTEDIPDLTDYIKNTDYATANKGGVIKAGHNVSVNATSGVLSVSSLAYNDYLIQDNYTFIGKGTLENVITGKGLTTKSYVDGLIGDIDTILTALTTGNGV